VFEALTVTLFAAVSGLAAGSHFGCNETAVAAVEHRLVGAQTWKSIYRSIKTHPECDDGVIAEEYSDRVVHLLATRWKDLTTLNRLVQSDVKFREFVIGHIDATADVRELRTVMRHATHDCPRSLVKLCREIEAAANTAAREAGGSE
jgi:hypothetical protein